MQIRRKVLENNSEIFPSEKEETFFKASKEN